jgi:hypothetical protein
MGQTANISCAPEFYSFAVTQAFNGRNLRLGVITNAAAVSSTLHLTNRAAVIAAEFNGGGWTRPNLVIPSLGSFDATNNEWDISTTMEWTVTGPTGGFDIKQIFVMIDGSATPRDTSGTLLGLLTYPTAISLAQGASLPLRAPWSLSN